MLQLAAAKESSEGHPEDVDNTTPALGEPNGQSQSEGSDSAGELSSLEDEHGQAAPSENRSFASTYWRPERRDRRGDLSVIDERCCLVSQS